MRTKNEKNASIVHITFVSRDKSRDTRVKTCRQYSFNILFQQLSISCLFFAGGLNVLVDGEEFQGFDALTNVSVNLNGSVAVSRPQNNSFLVTFPSGISVTATEIKESLSIVFAAPVAFKGYTKGLLGTWNDDPFDDFLRPDGTTLAPNATGREIHYSFGLQCMLSSFRCIKYSETVNGFLLLYCWIAFGDSRD